jgi:hypothetical protein
MKSMSAKYVSECDQQSPLHWITYTALFQRAALRSELPYLSLFSVLVRPHRHSVTGRKKNSRYQSCLKETVKLLLVITDLMSLSAFSKVLPSPYTTIFSTTSSQVQMLCRVTTKSESPITNLATHPDTVTPAVCPKKQCDSTYCDLSSASDLVLQSLLSDSLSTFGLSAGYTNWFRSCVINRLCYVLVYNVNNLKSA